MAVRKDIGNIYSSWSVSKKLRKLKALAIEYKGGKCIMCGYHKCSTSLVFHHRNPEEKELNISNKVTKWEKLKPELDKCDLLCLNCHGEVHEIIYQQKLANKEAFIRSQIPAREPGKKSKNFSCKHCKSAFEGYNNRQFCSPKCKADASRKIPNSANELQNLVNTKSIKVLAANIGVSERAIQKACKKAGVIIPKQKLMGH